MRASRLPAICRRVYQPATLPERATAVPRVAVGSGAAREPFHGALVGAAACGLTFGALGLCCQTASCCTEASFTVPAFVAGTLLSAVLGPVLPGERRA
jgi:hypothetical protein